MRDYFKCMKEVVFIPSCFESLTIYFFSIFFLQTIFFAELYPSETRKVIETVVNYVIYKVNLMCSSFMTCSSVEIFYIFWWYYMIIHVIGNVSSFSDTTDLISSNSVVKLATSYVLLKGKVEESSRLNTLFVSRRKKDLLFCIP